MIKSLFMISIFMNIQEEREMIVSKRSIRARRGGINEEMDDTAVCHYFLFRQYFSCVSKSIFTPTNK